MPGIGGGAVLGVAFGRELGVAMDDGELGVALGLELGVASRVLLGVAQGTGLGAAFGVLVVAGVDDWTGRGSSSICA
jgi:hypothetical protein